MKPRNREVNIFNMSLLDILCGALGAFCFMMLVLFPFWKPGGPNAVDAEKKAQELMQQMEELKKAVANSPGGGGDIAQKLGQLQQQMQQQQGELNRAMRDLEESKQKVQQLEIRNPIEVIAMWRTAKHDVDIYLQSNYVGANKHRPPDFDPTKKQGQTFFGEGYIDCSSGPCSDIWTIRDTPAGGEIKIYYRFFQANGNPDPVSVYGYFLNNGDFYRLPIVELKTEKTGAFLGTIFVKADYKIEFKPAPEYAAAYKKMMDAEKQPPPPK